jgi:tetraacyldisaccharide 4'-kinase
MTIFKYLLFPIFLIYWGIIAFRNVLYDKKIFKSSTFDLPIITIGNLSMGGTGKTPHTEYLIQLLQDEYKITTLSRGYGRKTNEFIIAEEGDTASVIGDEPLQYHLKFPKINVAVEKKRVLGVLYLLHFLPETDVILLDDAFQHRALNAGLNILITDFEKPYFEDALLPFGELREPAKGAERAQIIIVSKCPATITTEQKKKIIESIARPTIPVFFTTISYSKIYNAQTKEELDLPLKSYEVLLVTGIAKPKNIYNHLESEKISFSNLQFADHHKFTKKDIQRISEKFDTFTTSKKIILTTEKDYARMIEHPEFKKLPVYCLPVAVEFLENKEQFDQLIINYVRANKRDSSVFETENQL